jgi:hypothetical protein
MRKPENVLIRSHAELCQFWSEIMGAGGFDRRSVWLLFLAETGRVQPVIIPIDDVPPRPEGRVLRNLDRILRGLLDEGPVDSVAALLARPGPPDMTDDDRAWARGLAPLTPRWPVHLATAGDVRVFAGDDLIAAC